MIRDLRANSLWFSCLLFVLATPCSLFGRTPSVLTVSQYYNLTNEEARVGVKVRIEGTVLYSDPDFGLLWIQDETGRLLLPINKDQIVPPARSTTVVTGKTKLVNGAPKIVDVKFRKTGKADLQPPKMLTPSVIQGRQQEDSRVLGAGTVIQASMKGDNHIRLVIAFLRRYQFRVTINNCSAKDLKGLLGSHIEVVGCATRFSNVNHPELEPMQMFVPDMSDVAVFQRGPTDIFDSDHIQLAGAAFEFQSRRDPRLVRVTGTVESQPNDEDLPNSKTIILSDENSRLTVRLREKAEFEVGNQVEAVGIIWQADGTNGYFLDYAAARLSQSPPNKDLDTEAELPMLRTVQSVRGLTSEMAARKYPVEIRGLVTYYDPAWRVLFVNDETGGIYVNEKSQTLPIQLGDRVVVRGVSNPGGFSSMVAATRVQRIAKGQLPDSRYAPAARVLSGAEDSQWLTLTATVQSVEQSQKNLVLNLHGIQKNYPFQAVICGGAKHFKRKTWVGSEIEITGVCGTKANPNHQATGIYFHVPSMDQVEFMDEATADPFAIPQVAIVDLLKFNPKAEERLKQVRISGVVTFSGPSGQIAVQDDGQGILLHLKSPKRPLIGDRIDVIGYPVLNSTQRLQATSWRLCGNGALPNSIPVTVEEIFEQGDDGQFVSMQALVLRNNSDSVSPGLSLQSDGTVFSADLSSSKSNDQWSKLRDGSIIRLEGVLDVIDDGWGSTQSFRLLCPNTATVELVRAAPLWTSAFGRMLVLGLGFMVMASVLWVFTLRRSVAMQREQIQNSLLIRAKLTERHNKLIDNARELIFSILPTGEFVTVNPATTRSFQSTAPDLVGCQISEFLMPQSVFVLQEAVCHLSAEQSRAQLELTTKDNLILETAIYLRPDTSEEKQIQCIARDVSERRRLENQMRHMQKMESIGQLAAGIAHDYNNLMTVVLCHSEILLECSDLNHEDADAVQQIKDAAERAASLTRQLLAFSRRQIMSMTVFQPKELLAGLKEMLQRLIGESISLEWDFGEDIPCIQADRGMLEQVIVNLALNSRDAMPQGGHLKFALSHHRITAESTSPNISVSPGEYVQISVTDTGCGIHPDDLSSVFEPFYTSKEVGKGTGLGLSTAFGIIRQHKGWIDVESTLGVGTIFTILLPAVSEESKRYENPASSTDAILPTGFETILVVEDDQNVRQALTKLLSLSGYEVLEAGNGVEALKTWRRLQNKIDMIITDMIMPGGISGYEMAQQIKAIAPETRLIYFSGYSHEIAKLSALDATERLLPKPYENQALLHSVRELLDFNATVKN